MVRVLYDTDNLFFLLLETKGRKGKAEQENSQAGTAAEQDKDSIISAGHMARMTNKPQDPW